MLYGTDYRSDANRDDARLVRRFRRDVMFLFARPQEVAAAGFVAGLAVLPLVIVVAVAAAFLYWIVFGGQGSAVSLASGAGPSEQGTPTSRADLIAVICLAALTLGLAGAITASLRRLDYRRQGGLRYYLHHPKSALALLGFFAPVTAVLMALLGHGGGIGRKTLHPDLVAGSPSVFDRGVLYLFLGITLSMLLYLVWETCFPLILPTLSDMRVDDEVARLQREDDARVRAEEDRMRGFLRR